MPDDIRAAFPRWVVVALWTVALAGFTAWAFWAGGAG